MFVFLVALGFGSSMLFSMIPWEHYANCFENGMVPDLSSKEKKCIEVSTPQAFGYHEEREKQENMQFTGLFNDKMQRIMFPVIDTEYLIQIVLHDPEYQNATINVGYGLNKVENFPSRLSPEYPHNFTGFEKQKQTAYTRNSSQFHTGNMSLPIISNFTTIFNEPGLYHYTYFDRRIGPNSGGGSSSGGYFVVEAYSKAVNDDGTCKNSELLTLPKHDFTKLVCVTPHGHHELITRGWAPLPG